MKEHRRRITVSEEGANALNRTDGTDDGTTERRYLSISCNHCEKPACTDACPVGNIKKDEATGIVVAGNSCISCGRCIVVCPQKARHFGGLVYKMAGKKFTKAYSSRKEPATAYAQFK